jgi:hypothetical protein
MGFLVKVLSISKCNVDELRLAIIMLTEALNIQALFRGCPIMHGKGLTKAEYDVLYEELAQYEGLLYIKTRERLIWRGPGEHEWVVKSVG